MTGSHLLSDAEAGGAASAIAMLGRAVAVAIFSERVRASLSERLRHRVCR
nr:hypothetical protein [Streptomyces sp. FT05W]